MTLRLKPAGVCIYCGAKRYSPDREKLGDEHIVPQALSGGIVLPLASCQQCERAINWFEHHCMTKFFGQVRYYLGLKSKRLKDRPHTLPINLRINGQWETHDIAVNDAPIFCAFPVFDKPGYSPFTNYCSANTNILTDNFLLWTLSEGNIDKFKKEYGADQADGHQVLMDSERFALMLAKIAHAWAYSSWKEEYGPFNPVLPPLILRKHGAAPLPYYIGGEPETPPPEENSAHPISLEGAVFPEGNVYRVRIRLFAHVGAPVYYVIVSAQRSTLALVAPPSMPRHRLEKGVGFEIEGIRPKR